MALVLSLLAAWIVLNIALLALAAVLDRRHGPADSRGPASCGSGPVGRLPHP